jgi:hypothetical protein
MSTKSRRRPARGGIHPGVEVRSAPHVYPDASGAPAVLAYRGFVFALDMLGEVKLHLIGEGAGLGRVESKIARDVCLAAYLTLLGERVDEDWRARNIRLYDDEPGTCPSTHGQYRCALAAGHDGDLHQTEGGSTMWHREAT